MFASIKREGEKDENLASIFFSVLLSTNSLMIFFLLKYIFPKGYFSLFPYNIILKLMIGSVFLVWYFICNHYLLKRKNYKRIISFYENIYKEHNKKIAWIGVLYSLATFLVFYMTAIYLANETYF
ncbi:hypothetical protein EAH81_11025 [Flavobacterium pectinovorum]|uniref:Uncharacterized protein n=1 Tax=Flavobacterium pectinovorum TaxID=29533 RepID=A0A502EWQ3_9FLAO|nr:hypothetical protein EAH81_11025 [Flavobacterium pectinovorum]